MFDVELTKEVFNHWALVGRSERIATGHDVSVRGLLKHINYDKCFRFLDIGCGNGWVIRKIARQDNCSFAYGIDISQEMIKLANGRRSSEKEYYIYGNFNNWGYEGQFDCIFSMEVLYYFENTQKILDKIYNLLSDCGQLIFGVDYYKENYACVDWPEMVGLPMRMYSEQEWISLLQAAGFQHIETFKILNKFSDEQWKREIGTLGIKATK